MFVKKVDTPANSIQNLLLTHPYFQTFPLNLSHEQKKNLPRKEKRNINFMHIVFQYQG